MVFSIWTHGRVPAVCNAAFCIFHANSAEENGGVIYVASKQFVSLSHCVFTNNNVNENGGVLYLYNSHAHMDNVEIQNNKATQNGGAMFATCVSFFAPA